METTQPNEQQREPATDCSTLVESILANAPSCYNSLSDKFSYVMSTTDKLTWQQVYSYLLGKEKQCS